MLALYRACRAVFFADTAADALLGGHGVQRQEGRLFACVVGVAGHFGGAEAFGCLELFEKLMQLCLVACVGAACTELRIDRMRSYHLAAGDCHKAAFFGKLAHLEQRIVNGTVAENGNGNAWRFIAAYDLHAIVHGLGYPAAVDREAEECERIMVDGRVHARSGQLLHGSIAQLLADDVRDGFCSAAGAEVKNRVFHCLFPFLFLLPLYVQINPPVCNMCALRAFRQRHSCRTLPVKPRYCRRGSYSQAVRLFFRRSKTY